MPLASNKMSVGHAQVTHHTHIHVHTHRHTVRNVRGPCPVMYLMERKGKCQLFLKMAASSCVGYKAVAVDWCCQTYGQHISLSWCMCSVAYLLQWIASMLNWGNQILWGLWHKNLAYWNIRQIISHEQKLAWHKWLMMAYIILFVRTKWNRIMTLVRRGRNMKS